MQTLSSVRFGEYFNETTATVKFKPLTGFGSDEDDDYLEFKSDSHCVSILKKVGTVQGLRFKIELVSFIFWQGCRVLTYI